MTVYSVCSMRAPEEKWKTTERIREEGGKGWNGTGGAGEEDGKRKCKVAEMITGGIEKTDRIEKKVGMYRRDRGGIDQRWAKECERGSSVADPNTFYTDPEAAKKSLYGSGSGPMLFW